LWSFRAVVPDVSYQAIKPLSPARYHIIGMSDRCRWIVAIIAEVWNPVL
jgi:hypothetical protein